MFTFNNKKKEDSSFDPPFFVKFTSDSVVKRRKSFESITLKYPNRVPVLVERGTMDSPEIDKNKFLVPKNITLADFMTIIRSRIKMDSTQSLYFMVNGVMPRATDYMDILYNKHKNIDDGFLYITYCIENTFG